MQKKKKKTQEELQIDNYQSFGKCNMRVWNRVNECTSAMQCNALYTAIGRPQDT